MPAVVLSREEATAPDLPLVCVRCGATALACRRMPLVGWWLGPVQAPLCMDHFDHWRWRTVLVYLGVLVTGPGTVVGLMMELEELGQGRRGPALLFLAIATMLLLLTLAGAAVLYFTAVRVARVDEDT